LFLLLLLAGGDIFPLVGSAAGLLWIIGRVMYAHGYYTGNPQNRAKGWPAYIGLLTLLVSAIINGLDRLDLIDVR
jgi:glutathione S-transferase